MMKSFAQRVTGVLLVLSLFTSSTAYSQAAVTGAVELVRAIAEAARGADMVGASSARASELILGAARGGSAAKSLAENALFAQHYNQLNPIVLNGVRKCSSSDLTGADHDEIAQEVWKKFLYRNTQSPLGPMDISEDGLRGYLHQAGCNEARTRSEGEATVRMKKSEFILRRDELVLLYDLSKQLIAQETLNSLMKTSDLEQRNVLRLRGMGYSTAQIAVHLSISESKVKRLESNAVKQLLFDSY